MSPGSPQDDADHLRGESLVERSRAALAVPLVRAVGAHLRSDTDPTHGVAFVVDDLASNGAGGMHASAVAAVMETAGYLALLPHLTAGEHAVTHTMTLNLIRAVPLLALVEASGAVDRRTGRMAFVTVEARADDLVVARAQLVKSIVRLTPASTG